jgi:4-hydroxy-2-oxoheptanedioate aldolase
MATLREVWDRGDVNLGGWCVLGSPLAAELIARVGFDWVCVDTQHGVTGHEQMVAMLTALSVTDTPAFVRVAGNEGHLIGRALDAGAQGVIVPMVNSAEEARRAVSACRYAPEGLRSWGPIRASLGVVGYDPEVGNRRVICAVMVETAAGVEAIESIVEVPGVDAVYVGPNDLTVSYGKPPSSGLDDPESKAAIARIARACSSRGVVAGIHCPDVETALAWRGLGYRMFTVATDGLFVRQGAANFFNSFRRNAAQTTAPAPAQGSNY